MKNYRYLKHNPMGFTNTALYFRVRPDDAEAVAKIEDFILRHRDNVNGSTDWTNDRAAARPGIAVDWADRHWCGLQ
jgi:hypothetical protein